jgi:ATP-binding cassette, subfamily A (ABC1), member 3
MEETDAIADRVGVMSKRMLDTGTTHGLRAKYGDSYHVHLILKSAPATPAAEMERVTSWVKEHMPGAVLDRTPYNGQLRFNVPVIAPSPHPQSPIQTHRHASPSQNGDDATATDVGQDDVVQEDDVHKLSAGQLFCLIEENKEELGLAYHSVDPASFDQVFLKILKAH